MDLDDALHSDRQGKMPNAIDGTSYSKEYKGDNEAGKDALCVQRSAASPGKRVVLIDDLVATGGTLLAGVDLVKGLVGLRLVTIPLHTRFILSTAPGLGIIRTKCEVYLTVSSGITLTRV